MHFISSLLSLSLLSLLLTAGEGYSQAEEATAPSDSTQLSPPAQPVLGAQGRELTIDEAIARAMGRSYNVVRAENERDAARELARSNLALVGPRGTITYNEFHYDDTQVIPAGAFGPNPVLLRDDTTKTGSLIVTQPITGLYGYIENARRSGVQEDLSEETLRKERSNAGFAGAEAFLRAYNAQEQVIISESAVAAAQSSANDATVSNRVGRMNKADYLRLQVNLSQAQSRLAQMRAERVAAIAALRQTLRLPPEDVFYLKQDLPEPQISSPAIEAAINEALGRRPDVKEAALRAEVVSFQKQAAYAEFIPSVEVFGQLDRNFGEVTGLGNPERDVQYWGVKASWTFWNNGASVFKTREAFASTRAAEAVAEQTKDLARVDVIAAVENLQAAREALKFAEAGVAQAEEAYRIDNIRFKSGSITATDQILSESTKSNVQGQFVNSRTQLLASFFRLQKALGQDQPKL
ncbi:MAG: TolC family protein [Bdellovibrionota bacterium]